MFFYYFLNINDVWYYFDILIKRGDLYHQITCKMLYLIKF